jgi:hypothetical protein
MVIQVSAFWISLLKTKRIHRQQMIDLNNPDHSIYHRKPRPKIHRLRVKQENKLKHKLHIEAKM